jgi:hypothetical protein
MCGPGAMGPFLEAYMVSEFCAVFGGMSGVQALSLAEVQVRFLCAVFVCPHLFCMCAVLCCVLALGKVVGPKHPFNACT